MQNIDFDISSTKALQKLHCYIMLHFCTILSNLHQLHKSVHPSLEKKV